MAPTGVRTATGPFVVPIGGRCHRLRNSGRKTLFQLGHRKSRSHNGTTFRVVGRHYAVNEAALDRTQKGGQAAFEVSASHKECAEPAVPKNQALHLPLVWSVGG